MEEIKKFLLEKLEEIDVDEDMIPDMNVTTEELGLSSLELVDIATALNKKYGSSIKLEPGEEVSLEEICKNVSEQMAY